jgi:predicted outer membrane protein
MVTQLVKSWVTRALGKEGASDARSQRRPRRVRQECLGCERLEGRVVLTIAVIGDLFTSLSHSGVVTSPQILRIQSSLPGAPTVNGGSSAAWTKLDNDMTALENELQSLAAKSGLTIADLQSLTVDTQAIVQARFRFSPVTLNPVIYDLATAVAAGSTKPVSESEFSALFAGSKVPASVIDKTFSDLVLAIEDSHVTLSDLTTVASEEATVRTDLSNLGGGDVLDLVGWLNLVDNSPLMVNVSSDVGTPPIGVSLPPFVVPTPISLPPVSVNPHGTVDLLASLSYTGVVTGPVAVFGPATTPPASSNNDFKQLLADMQALQKDLANLAARSDVTIADLESLTSDSQAVAQAGFHFDPRTLNPVTAELAAAVASGSSITQAQSDFAALFNGSSVAASAITTMFNDLVTAIQDSKVTPTNLTTVSNQEAAIRTDLQNLGFGNSGAGTSGGSGSTGTSSGNGSTGGSNGGGGTGTSTGSGHHHKVKHPKKRHPVRVVVRHHLARHLKLTKARAHETR